ncbi:MAG: CoA transferase, partial [Desulfobacterales bacterium]|nr:CoA transferase [Desulfobacterales bacterium]
RIIADFGAEVIKLQTKKIATGAESNESAYFRAWNRNKRSITLDLSYPEAKDLFLELTRISDVVVENFSPRVMQNWGLNYNNLKKVRPDLIMISMSAMGQTGPWKNFVAFGPTLQSLGGLSYLTSFSKDTPLGLGYAYADMIAGLYGAVAILAALEYRRQTGCGQYIDLSEYEAVCTTIGPTLLDAFINPDNILPQGNSATHIPAAPYGCYKCSGDERWCALAVFSEDEWQSLCNVLGNPSRTGEERFSSLSNRKKNKVELDKWLADWMATRSAEEAVKLLQGAGIPAGIIQNAGDLAGDPHLHARNFFTELKEPDGDGTQTDTSPIKFTSAKNGPWKAAPSLGRDNYYVYGKLLGLTEAEIKSYIERGIIA